MKNRSQIILFNIVLCILFILSFQNSHAQDENFGFSGPHWFGRLEGINKNTLLDLEKLENLLVQSLRLTKANLLNYTSTVYHHHHENGSTNSSYIGALAESHGSLHVFPEKNMVLFDVFTCGNRCDHNAFMSKIIEELKPEKLNIQILNRQDENHFQKNTVLSSEIKSLLSINSSEKSNDCTDEIQEKDQHKISHYLASFIGCNNQALNQLGNIQNQNIDGTKNKFGLRDALRAAAIAAGAKLLPDYAEGDIVITKDRPIPGLGHAGKGFTDWEFKPQGFTQTLLLDNSGQITIHTYPSMDEADHQGRAFVDIMCSDCDVTKFKDVLANYLESRQVSEQHIDRTK